MHEHDDQRGPRGAIEGEQGVHNPRRICLDNKKTRKQTGRQNKSSKEARTNMPTKTTNYRIKSDEKIAEKTNKGPSTRTKGKRSTKENKQKPAQHRTGRSNGKRITQEEEGKPTRICTTSIRGKMSNFVQKK